MKIVTMYCNCFLSKMTGYQATRTNDITRLWEIFGAKTVAVARISYLFDGLNVNTKFLV